MSDEEIAREAAAEMITVTPYTPEDGDWWVCVGRAKGVSPGEHSLYRNKGDAEFDRDIYRRGAVPFILAAIQKARQRLPLDSPVSAEELESIREANELGTGTPWQPGPAEDAIAHLLAHIDHLERMVAFLSGEPEGEAGRELLRLAREQG